MNSSILRWFSATIALLLLIMPVLLSDELSLLANWIFTLICWFLILIIGQIKLPSVQNTDDKPEGQ